MCVWSLQSITLHSVIYTNIKIRKTKQFNYIYEVLKCTEYFASGCTQWNISVSTDKSRAFERNWIFKKKIK